MTAARFLLIAPLVGVLLGACADTTTQPTMDDPEPEPPDTLPTRPVEIIGPEDRVTVGEVVQFEARLAEDVTGTVVWSLEPEDAGTLDQTGRFVGHVAGLGNVAVFAEVGADADTIDFSLRSRGVAGAMNVVGHTEVPLRGTTDLWVKGEAAYTGTQSRFFMGETRRGNALHTWDVSDPANPILASTLEVDAGKVNDIKVSEDGSIGVLTHEGSRDRLNGISILDLSDPLDPSVVTRYTQNLENGVHNLWIDGDYLYVAGEPMGFGLRLLIVDISDPANPVEASAYFAGSSILHDVYVRDGLAFLSHWDAGLVILDVGNGVAGGSPENPVEVSRLELGGNTHNAWYWPETGYVFVGEEDFNKPGILHVVDASDLANPEEVATYGTSGATPHNFWLDEASGLLYVSAYRAGLHVLDVSGELWGDLGLQGRVITRSLYNNNRGCQTIAPDCTASWAPQLENGLVYVSDIGSGLWILERDF